MAPRLDGERARDWTSTAGGGAPRGVRIASAPRLPQAPRPVDTPRCTPRAPAGNACKNRCRTALAWAAAAPQALSTGAPGVQATCLAQRPVRSPPRAGPRGRPGPATPPAQVVSASAGALASRVAVRPARVDHPRGGLLAPHALDDTQRPPQALLAGDNGPGHAARGVRFRKAPRVLAASRALKTPARSMALWLVRTGCGRVDAAWAHRMRHALQDQGGTCPHHQGTPGPHPTARWVLHDWGGSHGLLIPGPWPVGLHLTEAQPPLLNRRGKPSERLYR
jgi:hypothetical protein